jgi:hypothetical protein
MSPFVLPLIFAQAIPIPIPVIPPPAVSRPSPGIVTPTPAITQPQEPQMISVSQPVRPLPGKLDSIPVFNSNNPELIFNEGIILSTLSSVGMAYPYAHLNYQFKGRFDVFAHHVIKDLQ